MAVTKKLAEETLVELNKIYEKDIEPEFKEIMKLDLKNLGHDAPMKLIKERHFKVGSHISKLTNLACDFVELQRQAREYCSLAKDEWEERRGLLLETLIHERLSTEERKSIVFARAKNERSIYREWEKVSKTIDCWMKMIDKRISELTKLQKSLLGHVGLMKIEQGIHHEYNADPMHNATHDDVDLRNINL